MLLKQNVSSLLGSKQPSFKFAGRVSQLQDRDNEGRGFIRRSASYLSCLENPTDARSIVCDAKEDVLASYQKTAWNLHLQPGVFKFELMVCWGTIAA